MRAIDYLIDWAKSDNWKKHLLNSIIRDEVNSIEKLADAIKHIIENDEEIKLLITESGYGEDNFKLVIEEIKNPQNISALYNESSFALGTNLNVFYGENGSGKSSYVKMFRKLAENYFTNQKHLNILSNVYEEVQTNKKQTLDVIYRCDKDKFEETVDINENHKILTHVNVFDADSVTPLLNTDLTFSILPQGFNYFRQVISLLDSLKSYTDKIITENEGLKNTVFSDSSFKELQTEINVITANVKEFGDLEKYLKDRYPLDEGIEQKVEMLEKEIKELESTNNVSTIKLLTSQKNRLQSLDKSIERLSKNISQENIEKINILIDEYLGKVEEERELNESFSESIGFLKVFNNEWLEFMKSGKAYYVSIEKNIPSESDRCIFCGQNLEQHNIDLIENCFRHIDSKVLFEKSELEKKIKSYNIKEVAVSLSTDDEALLEKEKLIGRIRAVVSLINANKEIFVKCIEESRIIDSSIKLDFEELTRDIKEEINYINEKLELLSKSVGDSQQIIRQLKEEKDNLIKRIKLYDSFDEFKKWYTYNDNTKKLIKVKANFSTTSLTRKAREAFNKLVEENYQKTFSKYCKKLSVTDVSVKFTPKKGTTYRSKYVSSEEFKVTDVMSEGEQKAIAMAEFATDLSIRQNYNTVIFDDPVTSLDYRRSETFANLIYDLSKDRQVIVFTHNIMFYYFLYNASWSDKNKENKFFKVEEYNKNKKGLISESFAGRLENLAQITKKIRNYKDKINSEKCLGEELEYTLSWAYGDIRTWCELIVEEGFLKNIIRRYEPNIIFNNVPKISADFVEELPKVTDLFSKSCRWMNGHSQPLETLHIKPTREDFNDDLEYIEYLYKIYSNK